MPSALQQIAEGTLHTVALDADSKTDQLLINIIDEEHILLSNDDESATELYKEPKAYKRVRTHQIRNKTQLSDYNKNTENQLQKQQRKKHFTTS
jgi:hypothetical protein